MKSIGLLTIALLFSCFLSSQDINMFVEKRLSENDITKNLPPLDTLIQRAIEHSPKLKYYEEDLKSWKLAKKEAKTNWMDVFSVGAGYSYGIFDNLNNQQILGDPTASQILLSTEQSRYNVTAAVKIPLLTVLGRNRAVKKTEIDIKKAEFNQEVMENEVSDMVIARYYDLVRAQESFLITNAMLDSYRIQANKAKTDYENGVISLNQFNTSHQMLNDGIKAMNNQKIDLILALKYLEKIVGMNLSITADEI